MKVGILDITALPSQPPMDGLQRALFSKQLTSIVPQVISVWCRQLGHETFMQHTMVLVTL